MQKISKQFSVNIKELLEFTPEQPFTKQDVEVLNFFRFHQRQAEDVVLIAAAAAINKDYNHLSKISFYNHSNVQPLLNLSEKLNKENCYTLVKLSKYAFQTDIVIELNDNLMPLNQDNIFKLQAAKLNCVENQSCLIIVPHTVNDDDVLFSFISAAKTLNNESDASSSNIFQYYVKTISLNTLLDLPKNTNDFYKNKEHINFFDILQIDTNNLDSVNNTLNYIKNYNIHSESTILDVAYLINPNLKNEDSGELDFKLHSYFGQSLIINLKIKNDLENLPEHFYSEPNIAMTLSEIFSLYEHKNSIDFFNVFFTEQPIAQSLTAQLFLNNINNVSLVVGKLENNGPLNSIINLNHNKLRANNKKKNKYINLPQAILSTDNIPNVEKGQITNKKLNYLQNFINEFNPENLTSKEHNYFLFLIYPYLKDEHRENTSVIEAALQGMKSAISTKSMGQQHYLYKNTDEKMIFVDNFFQHIPIQAFKNNYTQIYKNLFDFPNFELAAYFEIEKSLQDVKELNKEEYSHRPFQDLKEWTQFCNKNDLSTIIQNIKEYDNSFQKMLPLLSQLGEGDNSSRFAFYFRKFVEEYNPLLSREVGINSLSELFGQHIINFYPNQFENYFQINKYNAEEYFNKYNKMGDSIKEKLLECISNIEWDCSIQEEVVLFTNLLYKIQKKNVLIISQNPKTHQILKNPQVLKTLANTSFFTNSATDNNALPMQHIFSIDEIARLYEENPDKQFIQASPFTFIPLAPMKYKNQAQMWVDLIHDKSKISILQFMPLSIKNNPEVLLQMLKNAPKKTESIISNFSNNAKTNISVFIQALRNIEENHAQIGSIIKLYGPFINILMPNTNIKEIDLKKLEAICEELLLNKAIPAQTSVKIKTMKF